jgi:hypothetical protein
LAKYIAGTHAISFDAVVETMLKTGKDMRKRIAKQPKADWRISIKVSRKVAQKNKRLKQILSLC